jgi:hypothetical protein
MDYPYQIGSLKFEVADPQALSNTHYELRNTRPDIHTRRACADILLSLAAQPRLAELVHLELFRLEHALSDAERNELAADIGRSPYWLDLRSRVLARGRDCAFCGARGAANLFAPHRKYRNLVTRVTAGPGAPVCDACARDANVDDLAKVIDRGARAQTLVWIEQGVSERVAYRSDYWAGDDAIGRCAFFLAMPQGVPAHAANALLGKRGGDCRLSINRHPVHFLICFSAPVRLALISVLLAEPTGSQIAVAIPGVGRMLATAENFGLTRVLRFAAAHPTTSALLLFKADAPEELALRMIDVQGQFCEAIATPPPTADPVSVKTTHPREARGDWDAVQHVQRFPVPAGTTTVESVTFRIVADHSAQSLLVACYAEAVCKFRNSLLIPEVKPDPRKGTRLTFPFDFKAPGLTSISIFYLDRVPVIEPLFVGFKFRVRG